MENNEIILLCLFLIAAMVIFYLRTKELSRQKKEIETERFSLTKSKGEKLTETGPNLTGLLDSYINVFAQEGEENFDKYLRYSDSASGYTTDIKLAHQYLNEAVGYSHPDATFIKGVLLFVGEFSENGFEKDEEAGFELMIKGEELGCEDIGIAMASAAGINLGELKKQKSPTFLGDRSSDDVGVDLSEKCRVRINELHELGDLNEKQTEDLLEVIRSVEPLHLATIFGALHNEQELEKLKVNAGAIVGWDPDTATFYVG